MTNWAYKSAPFPVAALKRLDLQQGYIPAWFGEANASTLKDQWAAAGIFLFLKMKKEEETAVKAVLESRLREFLQDPLYREVRFLWIENPADPLILWRTHSIAVYSKSGKKLVRRRAFLNFRNYAFSIAGDVEIKLSTNSFSLKGSTPAAFTWSAAYGRQAFLENIAAVQIPMAGDTAGCLEFDFSIPKENWEINKQAVFGYRGLEHLDIGLRLFFRDPEFPTSGEAFYLASHRYPFLQEYYADTKADSFFPATIDWKVQIDLLYPLSRQRSYFEFKPGTSPGLPSAFRTNRGYTVHLLPQAGESRLVFAHRPATLREADLPDAPLYLVPSGKFELKVPSYATGKMIPEANVLCGISGLEYVKVLDSVPSYLNLVPDQAAFAPAFVSAYALLRDLTGIIESKAKNDRTLPEDTIDLDMPIEETYSGGLGINDAEREEILQWVRQVYFPPGFTFSASDRTKFMALEIVEDLINWLREMLQAAVRIGGNQAALVRYAAAETLGSGEQYFPTTSWAYFHEGNGATYYGQPDQAVLYKAESSSSEFLDYLEVPAIGLPDKLSTAQTETLEQATTHAALAFPMLPYGNVDPERLTDMLQLEKLLVNNFRYSRIREISKATGYLTPLRNAGRSAFTGTTPQGLLATFSPDPVFKKALQIERLQLAMNQNLKQVQMVNIRHDAPLKAVLQSNQLFMVITDPDSLKAYFSGDALKNLAGVTNQIDIETWLFELGTEHWDKNGTILVFKFHDKPLMELAAKPELWSLPNDFNRNKEMAGLGLQELVKTAIENGNSTDPKQRKKYAAILPAITQANWTGILAFNVAVPLGNLPDALKALAGGMDPNLFYAQYVGIEVTPVESSGTSLLPKPSSMFALIDYDNNIVPEADLSGYNFHVPYLTVVFRNSLVTDFAAEVQLFLEFLFHEEARLAGSTDDRNMISLKGVAEKHNGKTTYSFGFSGANRFELSGKVLQEVEIIKAQFATDPLPGTLPNPLPITGRFFFWGRMRFAYLGAFDALSFGAEPTPDPDKPDFLSMSNLQITMSFKVHKETATDRSKVTDKAFAFKSQQMAFDLNRSGWRSQSLYEKFPLKFKTFKTVIGDANALSASGYMPVNSPLPTAELGDIWYGIEYDLNLGSAGALAGSKGLVAGILVAWKPEAEGLYLGLKLPGSTGGKKEITIQGLLKIVFKSIRFESYSDPKPGIPDNTGYLLKLKNIVLKFMVVSFPPTGKTEIILFGDPRTADEVPLRKDKLLGWYASYVNDEPDFTPTSSNPPKKT
ncbi:MAG: hypothetical protein IPM36_15845 [Lewinellaceae bacterium]|nr:hypothetical protein [Lewinellaceae bacterium]